MPSYFLKIGSTDLSGYVDRQKFDMNREDVYEEWTDGNWVNHRVIARTRIHGAVRLGFRDLTDYDAFLGLLSTARTQNGSYSVSVFVNNLNAEQPIEAHIDVTSTVRWNATLSRQWVEATLEVTEC